MDVGLIGFFPPLPHCVTFSTQHKQTLFTRSLWTIDSRYHERLPNGDIVAT